MIAREVMAPLMFGGLVIFLLIGYPVAFSLAAVGLVFGIIGIELGYFQFALLQALPERVFGIMANDLLLAIPSSRSWAPSSNGAASPKTCSTASVSSSGRCAGASPMR